MRPVLGAEAQREQDTYVLALGGSAGQYAPDQGTRLLARYRSAATTWAGHALQDRLW